LALHPVDGTNSDGASLTFEPQIRQRPEDAFGAYGEVKWGKTLDGLESNEERTEANTVLLANRYGWSIGSMHSQGDRASNILLQTYLKAHKEKPLNGFPFRMDHNLMHTPENIELIKQLGVVVSIGPKYLFHETPENLVFRYGADRVQGMTPVKSLIEQGIRPTIESDVQLPDASPLLNLEKLVTRKDASGRTWGPAERVDRMTALAMYTKWATQYTGDEDVLGTIEAGKFADLVVLGGDFETVPEEAISDLPVVMTIVGGTIVFDRAADAATSAAAEAHKVRPSPVN
jgi:predicted amidohydrolase YtcJ